MENDNNTCFTTVPGFCPDCGSILPLLGNRGGVKCYSCRRCWGPEVFGDMAMSYVIKFNTNDTYAPDEDSTVKDTETGGPTVTRKCPQCGNNKMSYATLQLRSADEGQTIFYTCTKCQFKETENS